MDALAELTLRHQALKQERRSWEQDWKELARHFLPRKCRLEAEAHSRTNAGGLRGGVLDATPYYAMRDLAAGLHGGMTSPARPWFALALAAPGAAVSAGVKTWLGDVADRMRDLFHRSNFYNAIHQVYAELGAFGTAFFFALEDEDCGVRFIPLTAGEYCLDVNEKGRVDTVFRTVQMTLRQLVMEFGESALPEQLREMAKLSRNWNERFCVVHAVFPRAGAFAEGRGAYASVYYLDGRGGAAGRSLLREGSFRSFPGFGVRWDVTGGDVYGRGPAMDALPASRKLQQITATTIKSLHKTVDPPMVVPAGMENLSLLPGAVNYANPSGGTGQAVYPAIQINYNIAAATKAIMDEREQIKEGLFNTLFRAMLNSDRRQITAREVAAREEEKLILIGPVLERMHNELFTPLIERVFDIMQEGGTIPEPPDELAGQDLRVEFVSVLAQAQKTVATSGIEQLAGFVGAIARMLPEALDAVNADAAVDTYADYLGTPAAMLRGQDERDAARQQRAQAQEQAAALQRQLAAIDAAKKLGGASMKDSALGALANMQGAGGQRGAAPLDAPPGE